MSKSDDRMFPAAADNVHQSSNWLVGVIDDPQQAQQAEVALLQAGFSEDSTLLLHGHETLKRLRAKDEQRGPLGWAMKALSALTSDTREFEDNYAAEARAGHAILSLRVSDEEDMERARQLMAAHGAHYIKHYGTWVVTDLTPDPGGEHLGRDELSR